MIVSVPKEIAPDERRVAIVPAGVKKLQALGLEVQIESGAGLEACYPDEAYRAAGAKIVTDRAELFDSAQVIVQVRADSGAGITAASFPLKQGQCLVAECDPLGAPQHALELARTGAVVFALELIPRITRAQAMDVLSSMATVAGYKAVILAAAELPQMFPMLMTAAGTLAPARVLVLGAGVAGLQAIATARRLGAVVSAYDVRPSVKEQVESLGARFIEMPLESAEGTGGYAREMGDEYYRRQREFLQGVLAQTHVLITTAAIPGKKAPILITAEMLQHMPTGAVIVDLAAERGGNCEATRPGETIRQSGVTILGPLNLAASVPNHASQMYSNNVAAFLKLIVRNGRLRLDMTDEIVSGTLLAKGGEVVHAGVRELAGLGPLPPPVAAPTAGDGPAGDGPDVGYRLSPDR